MPQFNDISILGQWVESLRGLFLTNYFAIYSNTQDIGFVIDAPLSDVLVREGNKLVTEGSWEMIPFGLGSGTTYLINRAGIIEDAVPPTFLLSMSVGSRSSKAEIRLPSLTIPPDTEVKLNNLTITVPFGTI